VTRIAVVEVRDPRPDTAANVRAGLTSLAVAAEAGVELLLFPELYLGGYYLDHDMVRRVGEAHAGLERFQAEVDETGTAAVLGAALPGARGAEDGDRGTRPCTEHPTANTGHRHLAAPGQGSAGSPSIGWSEARPAGEVLLNAAAVLRPHQPAEYAIKNQLYPGEEQWFTPGQELWTGRVAGWPCGVAVCYEVGFPELARCLALDGAQLILLPAAFGSRRARIWDTLTRARAIENGCYVAAAGQAGTAGGRCFLGQSRVLDPFGEVVAGDDAAGDAEPPLIVGSHTVFVADIDERRVAAARRGADGWHRSLADRRPHLYRRLAEQQDE